MRYKIGSQPLKYHPDSLTIKQVQINRNDHKVFNWEKQRIYKKKEKVCCSLQNKHLCNRGYSNLSY